MTDRKYQVNEIFYSLQGEGMRAGTANVFVRLSGCNQQCLVETHGFDCDTEFVSGRRMTAKEIVAEAFMTIGRENGVKGVGMIFTGGEPLLQVDAELVNAARSVGFFTAIETNGSLPVPADVALDWITVSPKVAEHAIRQLTANEVKYVRGYGQGVPKTVVEAEHYLISPATRGNEIDQRALAWCVQLVQENPTWRMSVQQHKVWRVR